MSVWPPDAGWDAARIRAALPDAALAALAGLEVVGAIDSTNAELLRRPAPAHGTIVLLADSQTAGRGRAGRSWSSPAGANLYLSLSRRFELGLAALGGLSLAVGVAATEALRGLGAAEVQLKWPNDLVCPDNSGNLQKLGGVLIEAGRDGDGTRAVIGLGLNLRMPPEAAAGIDQPWCDLAQRLGAAMPPRETVAATTLTALLSALDLYARDGLDAFALRFDALDALRGRTVSAALATDALQGIAEGIAADGALRVRTHTGVHALHAGEVRVRPVEASAMIAP